MREKNIGFILFVVVFGYFCHCSSHNEDDKNRQTFVIRYKDGEQTIPVTVVLDYKKQTEYVINMNPRTPAKSVTLYDFKQKTIAYKDLTNRECFLGRLTHETLNEEISALQDVKNPVEVKPKLRSLDPKRPALTPTEIRNIAGQKTAVFCRKMNTWLLMPERSHGINKREADDEYEERTHLYQGHRSSQYSHFERQTRRRYRNRSQANPRHRSQENKGVAEDENGRLIVPEQHFYSHQVNSQSPSSSSSSYIPEDKTQNSSSKSFIKPYSSSLKNFENGRENENGGSSLTSYGASSRLHSNANKFGYPNYESRFSSSNGQPYNSRPLFGSSDYLNSSDTFLDRGELLDTTRDTSKGFEQNRPLAEIIAGNIHPTTEITSATDMPFSPRKQDVNYPNVHPSLAHLLPLYKPLGQEFDFNKPDSQASVTPSHPSNLNSPQSNIESELHALSSLRNEEDNKFIHLTNEDSISQNPDVSINVLEVPRITKEFENINVPISQPENVYGFHNASENRPSVPQTYFRNTHNFGKNDHLILSEHLPVSLSTRVNSSRKETYFNESSSHILEPDTSTTTSMPVLTTPQYYVTDRRTSSPIYVPSVHTAFQNSEDFNSFQIFQDFIQNNISSSLERNLTVPSIQVSNNNFFDNISGGITDSAFSPTEYPMTGRKQETSIHHRSDIPSEESNYRSIFPNHGVDRVRNSHPSFVNNASKEVVPSYRTRYQNVLRDFKPDEIVIDVENIPTHTLPSVTYNFQQKILTTIQPTVRSLSSGGGNNNVVRENVQISGSTWRPMPTTRYPRRINNKTHRPIQNGSVSHPQRGTLSQRNYHVKPQVPVNQLIGVNQYNPAQRTNRRQFPYSSRHNVPSQVQMPTELKQLHQFSHFNNLPPGVSVHPRHPQAPFADMVRSNRPPTMPVVHDSQSSLKPHRQRHHRKKERHNSCCRLRGKDGAFQSCCRNGGPCCSRSQRRIQSQGSSCCSQQKTFGQVIPANEIQPPIRTSNQISPPVRNNEAHRSDSGRRDRCQKEKMCRTLYESTQQVMVCRNAHVEGC